MRNAPVSDATGPAERAAAAVSEISRVVESVDAGELNALTGAVNAGSAVFLTGGGRSGLIGRAIAMRLMHVGLTSHVFGETTTPAVSPGDVVWVISATGSGAALRFQIEGARKAGATVVGFLARRDSALAPLVGLAVHVPADRTEVSSIQHAGSLFEQVCLVLGDSVAGAIQARRGISDAEMNSRHFNLY